MLHPRQIDAYWLQRELNKFYNDPEMSRSKSEEALEVLKVHFFYYFSSQNCTSRFLFIRICSNLFSIPFMKWKKIWILTNDIDLSLCRRPKSEEHILEARIFIRFYQSSLFIQIYSNSLSIPFTKWQYRDLHKWNRFIIM